MRKLLAILFAFAFLSSCTPKVNLPEGAPPYVKTEELLEKIQAGSMDFQTLVLKGKGRFQDSKQKQSFRFEMRIAKDSLIWIDIADPILGLKVARGQINAQETSYYNRLDRTFSSGSSQALAQKIGFQFDFKPLMAILSANRIQWDMPWYQSYQPGHYALVNFPQDSSQALPAAGSPLIEQHFDPSSYRAINYKISRPTEGQNLFVSLENYQDFENLSFPQKVHLEYRDQSELVIDLEFTKVEIDQKLSFPFRIPKGYEAI